MRKTLKYFGYITGLIFVCTGLVLLLFFTTTDYGPAKFKNMFAVVLILYGIYRIVVTAYKNGEEEN